MADLKEHPDLTPMKAIRAYCIGCCNGQRGEVKQCPAEECELHPYRLGRNPFRKKREVTPEQRAAAADRLREARQHRHN